MDKRPIGIFDSGVGGLTVLSEIKKELPNENLIYLGDTKNFPYGSKTKEEIIQFSIKNTEKLIELGAKIIVIACGTATSQAIEVLKQKFNIPIMGIIEPTVEYVKKQNTHRIGVIATEGTIRSGAWEKSLKKEIENIEVVNKSCPMLATIAEEGRATGEEGRAVIKQYMEPFKRNKIDKIILGCTHYPIYQDLIREELGYPVELINTGTTVSKQIKQYLKRKNLLNEQEHNQDLIFLSKPEEEFKIIAKKLLNFDIEIGEIS
jgi:glutamate racemase